MHSKETYIFDIEGTLYENKSQPLKGAIQLIEYLMEQHKNIFFVSNTTSYNSQELYNLLVNMGFPKTLVPQSIYTGLSLLESYIKEQGKNPFLIVDQRVEQSLKSAIAPNKEGENYDAVIVGSAKDLFTYKTLNKALNILLKEDSVLVACSKTRKYSVGNGLFAVDGGAYTVLLEHASQKKAVILGKPSPSFFLKPLNDHQLDLSKAVVIGDDIENDICGAYKAGLATILVKTGKASILKKKDLDLYTLKINKVVDNLEILLQDIQNA